MKTTYEVHQVDKNGTVLRTLGFSTKRAAVEHYRFVARVMADGDLWSKNVVEVRLYREPIGEMLLSTANGDK
jgi:hypothetical protein